MSKLPSSPSKHQRRVGTGTQFSQAPVTELPWLPHLGTGGPALEGHGEMAPPPHGTSCLWAPGRTGRSSTKNGTPGHSAHLRTHLSPRRLFTRLPSNPLPHRLRRETEEACPGYATRVSHGLPGNSLQECRDFRNRPRQSPADGARQPTKRRPRWYHALLLCFHCWRSRLEFGRGLVNNPLDGPLIQARERPLVQA